MRSRATSGDASGAAPQGPPQDLARRPPGQRVAEDDVAGDLVARALLAHTDLGAADIVKQSLVIAGELCIYTNMNHTIESL